MLKRYIQLTKPGIIFANLISVLGGFFLAAQGSTNYLLLISTLLGVLLVVASGCVFNNYIDRDIDKLMERTKNRVMAQGLITLKASLVYATVLGLMGVLILYLTTNPLVVFLAIIGFTIYVVVYSLKLKRTSVHATLIGSLSGAMPPVIGYCAVSGKFDVGAFILLLMFSLWQMPHSYAIAIFRFNDYQAAHIPVLPVVKGIAVTKNHITLYILAFMGAVFLLTVNGYAGYKYLAVVATVSLWWLGMALSGYKTENNYSWAKKVFLFSIVIIIAVSFMIAVDFKHPVSDPRHSIPIALNKPL